MKQTLLFDLDDTLIYCNKYFHLVLEQFAEIMTSWFGGHGISGADILQMHAALDIAGVEAVGFQPDHFPNSLVDTYRHYSKMTGRPVSSREEERLWQLGHSVYSHEVEPYPHMEETLALLTKEGHELHLYTGGDWKIQQRKIERLNLQRYFGDRIYVRQHKNTAALEQILSQGAFDRSATWMIGNSLRTDVMPALQCGIHSIYLQRENEWSYNLVPIDTKPAGAFLTLQSLAEVPPSIHQYMHAMTNRPD
jgi:putative hydrolase of the HAD superfamily